MVLSNDEINTIHSILVDRIRPYLIYLFGSSVNGIFREDSDIDITFLFDNELSDYEVFMIA